MKRLTWILCAWIFSGCATMTIPPAPHKFISHETFEAPFEVVWAAARSVFEEEGWTIERTEEKAGVLVSGEMKDKLLGGDYGVSPQIDLESATMVLNVKINRISASRTQVRVHCFFQVYWTFERGKQRGGGTSNGVVEELVLNALRKRLEVSSE